MATYSNVFGSQFPNQLIEPGSHKDIDTSVMLLINRYYEYMAIGDFNDARALYEQNKTTLEPYMIDMNYINKLEEEINNVGIAALSQYTVIDSTLEPADSIQEIGDRWIQQYE